MIQDFIENISEIDQECMKRLKEAKKEGTKSALIAILADIKTQLQDILRCVYGGFQRYASQPCPKTKI